MATYSVADAKSGLPSLIDRANDGEEVIISRHGKPVAELRPVTNAVARDVAVSHDWLHARRRARKSVGMTSVELLNLIYDDPAA